MTPQSIQPASTSAIQTAVTHARWTVHDLWVAALAIGGAMNHDDVTHIVSGVRSASSSEHDVLAAALNEHFVDHGDDHPVTYWRDL